MTSLVISDLNSNNTYACSVAAETAEGVGPFSHVIFIGKETNMTGNVSGEQHIFILFFLVLEPPKTSSPDENLYLYSVIPAVGSVIILVIIIIVSIIICIKCKQRKRKHWYEIDSVYLIHS